MKNSIQDLPELEIPSRLQYLIKSCEKNCVVDCCGISAFDFSAIHVASCISTHIGTIRDCDINEWDSEIMKFEQNFNSLNVCGEGLICFIPSMNQAFTEEAVKALFCELRTSVAASKQVWELSENLRPPVRAFKIMNDYRYQ